MQIHPSLFNLLSSGYPLDQTISINQCKKPDISDHLRTQTKQAENDYNPYYFQILVVTPKGENIETTLVTKTKEEFHSFPIVNNNDTVSDNIGDKLPAKGVFLKEDFLPVTLSNGHIDYDNLSKYPTARFLLQCRKLSQLIAKTWLSQSSFENELEYLKARFTREIFFAANLRPNHFDPDWSQIPDGDYTDYIIKADRLSQQGLQLSLLFAGQVYMGVPFHSPQPEAYIPVCESIFSTYEIIYEYALKVSWDTFYSNRVDYAQPGLNPSPPYYEVTISYPPRPELGEFTGLTEEKIETWVNAPEDGGPFPFYPEQGSDQVQYAFPPYPYIPLSCS